MSNMTVVYYTSNRENEYFENNIREQITRAVAGRHPIISVSQKPIDFGENICVGDVGCHDWNAFRQLRIGIEAAKTKFIAAAESDVLYPPEYFDFEPPTDGCWHYTNFYAMWRWVKRMYGRGFHRKKFSEGAQYASRDYWLSQFDRAMKDGPDRWMQTGEELLNPDGTKLRVHIFGRYGYKARCGGWEDRPDCPIPVIGIKTGFGLRSISGTVKGEIPVEELPYWGNAHDLRIKLFGDCHESCQCTEVNINKRTVWG